MTQKSAVIICFAAEAWNHALIILCSLQIAVLQVSTPSSVIWGWYRRFGFGDKMNISNEWNLVLLLSTNFKFFKQIIGNLANDLMFIMFIISVRHDHCLCQPRAPRNLITSLLHAPRISPLSLRRKQIFFICWVLSIILEDVRYQDFNLGILQCEELK